MTKEDLNKLVNFAEINGLMQRPFISVVDMYETTKALVEEIEFLDGLDRARRYHLEAEYMMCIRSGMTPAEACEEWDI